MAARGLLSSCGARIPEHAGLVVVAAGGLFSFDAQAVERVGLVAPWHVGSDQGLNPRPLHWKADS